jgi:ABC-type uncharacterized transport system permease subunit
MMAGIRREARRTRRAEMQGGASWRELFERRLTPADSPLAILRTTAALFSRRCSSRRFCFFPTARARSGLFRAFSRALRTLRGFGYSLVRASPLALIALGTIVSWRSGFRYLGFEGCFVLGAAADRLAGSA